MLQWVMSKFNNIIIFITPLWIIELLHVLFVSYFLLLQFNVKFANLRI